MTYLSWPTVVSLSAGGQKGGSGQRKQKGPAALTPWQISKHLSIIPAMSRTRASQDIFHAIADPTRRAIIEALAVGEQPAKHLLRISQPGLSQLLRVIPEAGLVTYRRTGREHWYSLNPGPLLQVAVRARLTALGKPLEEAPRSETPGWRRSISTPWSGVGGLSPTARGRGNGSCPTTSSPRRA